MKPAEKKLVAEDYATLVEQAPILIWRAGTDGLCDYFNQRWLEFTGRSMAQEIGNGWAEGVHPDDFQRCLDTYVDHFNRRAVFEMEYRLRRHDGVWRWIFDRGVPSYEDSGVFRGYIGSCIDVTERVEAQQALAEAQAAEIRTLHGLLPICMICKRVRDDDGYWGELEKYVRLHSGTDFSHGLCPSCAPDYIASLQAEAQDMRRKGLIR